MKKLWTGILSLLLLLPGHILMILFAFFFYSIIGYQALGFIIGSFLFGTLAALPVVISIWRRPMTRRQKMVRIVPLVGLYAAILMLSVVRIGGA